MAMSGRLRYAAAAAVRAFPHGASAPQSLPAAVPHGVPTEHSFHISRALGTSRRPRFSPLNRHNVEADELLDEIKRTKIGNVTDDMMLKTLRHSIRGCQQILFQSVLRSWVAAVTVVTGYIWGYSRVARRPSLCEDQQQH
uniref:Uncharacterized protein n=1 Tax=Avena sativa TaxID=4498 RepID=A0ACD5UP77_AVESA